MPPPPQVLEHRRGPNQGTDSCGVSFTCGCAKQDPRLNRCERSRTPRGPAPHHTVPYAPDPTGLSAVYLSGTSHVVFCTSSRWKPLFTREAAMSTAGDRLFSSAPARGQVTRTVIFGVPVSPPVTGCGRPPGGSRLSPTRAAADGREQQDRVLGEVLKFPWFQKVQPVPVTHDVLPPSSQRFGPLFRWTEGVKVLDADLLDISEKHRAVPSALSWSAPLVALRRR
ncbi:hypothetical protein GN956_G26524 [Arapaima gigas]